MYYYLHFARAFGWTPDQCDQIDLELFFDLLIVAGIEEKQEKTEPVGYIDMIL